MRLTQGYCPQCESRALVHADDVLPRLDQPKLWVCIDCGGLWVLLSEWEHQYWERSLEDQMKAAKANPTTVQVTRCKREKP